jgi:[acyl-carrier-protein] S-malonyltransferase
MNKAAERMKEALQSYHFAAPQFPVIANRHAQPYEGAGGVIENLSLQLVSPVRWRASIEYLMDHGAEIAIEIGPKNVLKFLTLKNTDSLQVYTTDNNKDMDSIREALVIKEDEYLMIIGRVLGAAVSIKNRNSGISNEEYEKEVVKPYRWVEALYKECTTNGGSPEEDQVKESLQILRTIMAAKKTPPQEQELRLNNVLRNKIIKRK